MICLSTCIFVRIFLDYTQHGWMVVVLVTYFTMIKTNHFLKMQNSTTEHIAVNSKEFTESSYAGV